MYSPSAYNIRESDSGGIFGRILVAKNEAKEEVDAIVAANVERRLHEEAEAKKEAEEKAGEELARKLHQEEEDEEVAHRMEEEEKKEFDKEQRARFEAEEAGRVAARRAAMEEKEEAEAEEKRRLEDERVAREMQSSEVAETEKQVQEIAKVWKTPKIDVANVEDGIVIKVCLPRLKTIDVDVDEETKVILVKASPAFDIVHEVHDKLPEDMRVTPLRITLDLKIVGKETVSKDEVTTTHDPKTGDTTIKVLNAFIRNDTSKSGFMSRMRVGLKRMLSSKSNKGEA